MANGGGHAGHSAANTSSGAGPRKLPWWAWCILLGLFIGSLFLHGHDTFIDKPLIHIGPIGVTLFAVIETLTLSIALYFVDSFLNSWNAILSMNKLFVVVKGLMFFGGGLFLIQMIVYLCGWNYSLADAAAHAGADIIHGWFTK